MYVLYRITCSENGKVYVGYSSKSAEDRFKAHLLNARWKRKTALYDAIRCYGEAAFSVETILQCESHAEACAHEIRLIEELCSLLPSGYNMTRGGDGVPLTKEQRDAANAKKRGVCSPKQLAANLRRKGQKASEETRAKLSAARRGRKQSPEQVAKRAETLRRKHAEKVAAGLVPPKKPRVVKPRVKVPRDKTPRARKPRIWTIEDRARERQRALAQWTPEAREAARERANKQWTPEARKKVSERMAARYAKERSERSVA
jgi:group I intron endonuclease